MEELEIEFKNMIDYPKYIELKESFFSGRDVITQTNFYIDSSEEHLLRAKIALRIRDTGDRIVMTLKVPQEIGIMEYHGLVKSDILDNEFINASDIPDNIARELVSRDIPLSELRIIGALSTERMEKPYQDGLMVLDASHYLDTADYELEFEVPNFEEGESQFARFLEANHIDFRPAVSKIQRFYERNKTLTSRFL